MTSKRKSIIADIVTTLSAISGFSCVRWSKAGTQIVTKPCAVVRWVADRLADGPTSRYFTRHLEVEVSVYAVTASGLADDDAAEAALATVEEAVMADRTCGGYARDIQLVETLVFPVVEGQEDIGGVIRFDVTYLTNDLA